MSKYKIKYTYERWYDLVIEAASEEEARNKFWSNDFDQEPYLVGGEIQDGVQVVKMEEENEQA
jgi:hypothetical protein